MAQASAFRWVFPLLSAGLLGWWWLSRPPEPAPAEAAPPPVVVESVAPVVNARPSSDRERVLPGGFNLPKLESATPAEVESMRRAEAARSVAAPAPPRSYTGADGKPHAFAYDPSPEEKAREQIQADRRDLLMTQLRADPNGFAKRHGLSSKEAQWILDGETDFPERLLN